MAGPTLIELCSFLDRKADWLESHESNLTSIQNEAMVDLNNNHLKTNNSPLYHTNINKSYNYNINVNKCRFCSPAQNFLNANCLKLINRKLHKKRQKLTMFVSIDYALVILQNNANYLIANISIITKPNLSIQWFLLCLLLRVLLQMLHCQPIPCSLLLLFMFNCPQR